MGSIQNCEKCCGNIVAHLEKVGVSVNALAMSCGYNQGHFDRVLKGERKLTDEALSRINNHLGTNFQKETKT